MSTGQGDEHPGVRKGLSRRDLIIGAAGIAALCAAGGGARFAFGIDTPLRPPGGQDEEDFVAKCIRCDRCRSACHLDAVGVASMNDGLLNARTPTMDFHEGYCDFCEGVGGHNDGNGPDIGLLCTVNCPTGALQPFDHTTQWIGLAVVDTDECVAFHTKGACGICVPACPYEAISLDASLRPVVDESACNGCGYCEYICPSATYRSYRGTDRRGINVDRQEAARPRSDGAGSGTGAGAAIDSAAADSGRGAEEDRGSGVGADAGNGADTGNGLDTDADGARQAGEGGQS